ncbi:MAG: sigma-70 family RNA polymerase sigma factor [Solirubrobacterales bacterium]|nr:sigma-70 family RNA polymerase sigma factor [Solirubrobacterales bacterium]
MSAPNSPAGSGAGDDNEIMAAVKAGSVDALGVLYERYCDRAYRIARAVCRDDGRAQEAVQETFISIWMTRGSYAQQRGKVAAWVLTVARNRAIDIARRNDPHAAHRASDQALHTLPAPDSVADLVGKQAQARDLHDLLAQLPDAQQEVITLAFYGELTHTEIAEHLQLPAGTVKGRMRLGLQRLRGDIERVAS